MYLSAYECLHAFVEKVKHLALLPENDIVKTFDLLVENLSNLEELPLIDGSGKTFLPIDLLGEFIGYFRRYWLKQVTPSQFSVFSEARRTNNDTERNNRAWSEVIGNHPTIVSFMGK